MVSRVLPADTEAAVQVEDKVCDQFHSWQSYLWNVQ